MRANVVGTRRYLYEYLFQQAVEQVKNYTGEPLMISDARRIRNIVENKLKQIDPRGMDNPRLAVTPVIEAFNEAFTESVKGYQNVFDDLSSKSPLYQRVYNSFIDMMGIRPDGLYKAGKAGPRVPISPYDPRWATRSSVKRMGTKLTYLLGDDVDSYADEEISKMHVIHNSDLHLWAIPDPEVSPVDVGQAYTLDDHSGLTELMGYMTADEYNDVRAWVLKGAWTGNGYNFGKFMSDSALSRSIAILEELRYQGVPYKIIRDREPGQIALSVEGTKIQVRLMDTRDNEYFVGRVYDDGAVIYYSTNVKQPGSNRTMAYIPTPEESVNLLRTAQGLPVDRKDGKGFVGEPGVHTESVWSKARNGYVSVNVPDSYYDSTRTHMAVYGDVEIPGRRQNVGELSFIRRSATNRTQANFYFGSADVAEEFLRKSVDTARNNIVDLLEVDRLIEEAREHVGDEEYVPIFSGDTEIAAVQRAYWDVLTGKQDTLLRPGATEEEFDEATYMMTHMSADEEQYNAILDFQSKELAYTGTPEEKIRQHAAEVPDGMVGTFDLHEVIGEDGAYDMKRFDPARVSKYMASENGTWRNTSDLVAALRVAEIDAEELMGEGYGARQVKDRLIKFNVEAAITRGQLEDGVQARMMDLVQESLVRGGMEVESITIDDQGIIAWECSKVARNGNKTAVAGYIGQVFEPGEYGEFVTKFASGENFTMVPGYEARVAAQRPGEDLSVEERTVLRGYEQVMAERIQYQIANDLLISRTEVGEPSSLNGVYRRLYDERLPENFLEFARENGLGNGMAEAVLGTLSRRVRYDNEMGNTFYQSWRGRGEADQSNDNVDSALILSGGRNMAILSEEGDGYFDRTMTNASNMGTTRYLTEGAVVTPDGKIVPSDPEDAAPLMKRPEMKFQEFNAWDRRQMISSVLLHATAITPRVGVMMSDVLKGWTADDGFVVSADFANENQMLLKDGSMRPLVVGDKITDKNGNKGVISLVVDSSPTGIIENEEALRDAQVAGDEVKIRRAEHVAYAQGLFRSNPGLSIVMSPFSGVSRFNAGVAREMMEHPSDAVMPDGKVVPGGIGTMSFIITNKDVDAGTRVYDEDALAKGRGRRASAQQSWALTAQGADKVMAEFYGPNGAAIANLREYLITMGLDMDEHTGFVEGTLPGTLAERRVFELPDSVLNAKGQLNLRAMRQQFGSLIGDRGGDLEVPFPMKFPTGETINVTDRGTYRLPVLSSHLRTGQELDDGSMAAHDYTNQYMTIYEQAVKYQFAIEKLEGMSKDHKDFTKYTNELISASNAAQVAFDKITSNVEARELSGKHNIYKEGVMSSRLADSATAVISADPSLNLNQLGLSVKLADELGLKSGEYLQVWRDPVLRDGGVRYLEVVVDDRLTGMTIHPAITKSFDADFDGDSFGAAVLFNKGARKQAHELLTVDANLVDKGSLTTIEIDGDEVEIYSMAIQDSLDTKVSQHFDPKLKKRFNELTLLANDIQADVDEGKISRAEAAKRGSEIRKQLDEYYHDALTPGRDYVNIRFDSPMSHLESVKEACIDTGAKGSIGKLHDYAMYMGVDLETGKDYGHTLSTRKHDEGVQVAVTVKTAVGVAGAYTQRAVRAVGLTQEGMKAATEITQPTTQAQLQAKHDPHQALLIYNMLQGPLRAHYRGQLLDPENDWEPARNADSDYIQATPEEWVEQCEKIYGDGLGVKINPEHAVAYAKRMVDPVSNTMVNVEDTKSIMLAKNSSLLDRLAYGGTFADLQEAAKQNLRLLDDQRGNLFAPYVVRSNLYEEEQFQTRQERAADPTRDVPGPEYEALAIRDVLSEEQANARTRGANKRTNRAKAVRAPRPKVVVEPQVDMDEGISL